MLEIQAHERGGPAAANALLAHGSPTVHLPHADEYFEVRFESIGGLARTPPARCWRRRGRADGLERRPLLVVRVGEEGLPRALVRPAGRGRPPVRTSAPIERPDVIVVFHAALLRNAATFGGLKADGTLIYNAPAGVAPPELAALPKTARVIRVDAPASR